MLAPISPAHNIIFLVINMMVRVMLVMVVMVTMVIAMMIVTMVLVRFNFKAVSNNQKYRWKPTRNWEAE